MFGCRFSQQLISLRQNWKKILFGGFASLLLPCRDSFQPLQRKNMSNGRLPVSSVAKRKWSIQRKSKDFDLCIHVSLKLNVFQVKIRRRAYSTTSWNYVKLNPMRVFKQWLTTNIEYLDYDLIPKLKYLSICSFYSILVIWRKQILTTSLHWLLKLFLNIPA